jgi:phosphate starvation-inducible PhoH-like protein
VQSKRLNKHNPKLNINIFDDDVYNINYNFNINENSYTKPNYLPTTENQKEYVKQLNDKSISMVVAFGPAGSGKTLFACVYAIKSLKNKSINKIILTRPIVPVDDEEIGYLPGNLQHKMDPWTKPIFDIFLEYYTQEEIDYMIKESIIEICPLSFMRGRTFKNSIIICDEMQNSTHNQMLMVITRVGIGSKIIITGDLLQSDKLINNGLKDIINRITTYKITNDLPNINIIELLEKDIQRSELVKDILKVYK